MITFGLVHGGGHGAWCWNRVIQSLEALGHVGVAMDLPISDEHAGAREYTAAALAALAPLTQPIALVGHSLGGLVLPLIAERRPVRRMIFLCATLPVPGKSLNQQRVEDPDILFPYAGSNGGLNKERFYNSCTPEDADWAFAQLRYQSRRVFEEVTPLTAWPPVPVSYVACSEDHAVNPEWGQRVARERLGVEAEVIVGSDHSPMINRPDDLARLLIRLAAE